MTEELETSQDKHTQQQQGNRFDWLKEYQWQKGQSGNPGGRPKGKSLKSFAREYLENMSEEGRIEFMREIDADIVWKMAEGLPQQDVTSGGQAIAINIVKYGNDKPIQAETVPDKTS